MSRFIQISSVVLGVAITASASHASTLAYDGFTADANSNSNIVGQGGGTGWGANWNSGQSDGYLHTVRTGTNVFSYTGYTTSSNPARSDGNYLNLASGFGGANPVGVFRGLDTSAGGTFGSAGYLESGKVGADGTTVWGSFVYSDNDNNNGVDHFNFSLTGSTGFTSGDLPQLNGSTANNHLLVFKVSLGAGNADTITYWADPTLATFDGTTGGTTSATANYAFNALVLTDSFTGGTGQPGAETKVDDIRFGTTLSDVVPVPEPASLAALGLLGLVATRRRR